MLGRIVVSAMATHAHRANVESLAFAVMSDHVHWLCMLGNRLSLDEVMRAFKGYTGY